MKFSCPCLTDISHKTSGTNVTKKIDCLYRSPKYGTTSPWPFCDCKVCPTILTKTQGFEDSTNCLQVPLPQQKGEIECWRNQVFLKLFKPPNFLTQYISDKKYNLYQLKCARTQSVEFHHSRDYTVSSRRNHTTKKQKNWQRLFLSPEKLAEKVHKSRRQNYATKVRLSSKCNEYCDKIAYLLTKYNNCVYLSKI